MAATDVETLKDQPARGQVPDNKEPATGRYPRSVDKQRDEDPIRVLHIITALNMGGTEMLLCKVLASMDRKRFSNRVISLMDLGYAAQTLSGLDVPVHALNIDGPVSGVRGLRRAAALIRATRPHVIHTWMHHADLFGIVAARLAGNPAVVWSLQNTVTSLKDVPFRNVLLVRALGWLSAFPRAVISVSEAGRAAHDAAGYRPRRWEVIPNGFDTRAFSPDVRVRQRIRAQLGVGDEQALIGLVGRYHPHKGHGLFLQAARKLGERRTGVLFVMAGVDVDDRNRELVDRIDELGLARNVRALGVWPDVTELLNALDILAISSTSEGFPTVLGEAMACGVPCVATDVGDCRAIVGETGRVVLPGDAEALARAWDELLELPVQQRHSLGRAARERIQSRYGLDVVVASYQNLYQDLAGAS